MKCPTCNGTGEVYEYGINYLDGDSYMCHTCHGTGEVFSLTDPQPWDLDHPGWGRFESHKSSKWKHRFVVSGCHRPARIVEFLQQKDGLEYSFAQFSESKVFPGENETYVIPVVYFFLTSERDPSADVSKAELTELYWY